MNINKKYPEVWRDVQVLYKGEWYGGYWEGEEWRIFTSPDGRDDDFVTDEEIEDWRED